MCRQSAAGLQTAVELQPADSWGVGGALLKNTPHCKSYAALSVYTVFYYQR